jgi:hypothetical protein
MFCTLSLSLHYLAIAVSGANGAISSLAPEREARMQLALLIAFVAICVIAWLLAPESPPSRRESDVANAPIGPRRVTRRR